MQIVKNRGNYESVRLEATWFLQDDEDINQAFKTAGADLEFAYLIAYGKKDILTLKHSRFDGVCQALRDGKTDLKELVNNFIISREVLEYFIKHDMI